MKYPSVSAGSNLVFSNAGDIATRSCNARGTSYGRRSENRKRAIGQESYTAVPFGIVTY